MTLYLMASAHYASTIGDRIRTIRTERSMSMRELGVHCGVTRHSVSNWEEDYSYPELRTFIKLCNALGVSADYLLGMEK